MDIPIHLSLSPRQAEALEKALEEAEVLDTLFGQPIWLKPDGLAALREVAEKLKTLREG